MTKDGRQYNWQKDLPSCKLVVEHELLGNFRPQSMFHCTCINKRIFSVNFVFRDNTYLLYVYGIFKQNCSFSWCSADAQHPNFGTAFIARIKSGLSGLSNWDFVNVSRIGILAKEEEFPSFWLTGRHQGGSLLMTDRIAAHHVDNVVCVKLKLNWVIFTGVLGVSQARG